MWVVTEGLYEDVMVNLRRQTVGRGPPPPPPPFCLQKEAGSRQREQSLQRL